jgi:selenide,water dikinase
MTMPPAVARSPIRLTSLSHGAGCACKLGSADLTEVLRHLPAVDGSDVLVDAATRDDAAVIRIAPDRALIATVDFFTPIVDDPADWGAIAAANALSDVYAMGGRPLFALNLVGWPREKLPFELLGSVMAGAARITARAGCPMVGGHSIDDPEPKFGLAVIGEAHPDRLLTNAGARGGDVILLTKPIGTGILTTALKRDLIPEAELAEAVIAMTTLNDTASRVALDQGATAATDITGFGLLGHLGNVLRASGVGATLWLEEVPLFARVRQAAEQGAISGGTRRNLEAAVQVEWAADISQVERFILADAQTSGGLLFTVPEPRADAAVKALRAAGTLAASRIGRITGGPGVQVVRREASA